jgi:hypothetical protein
MGRFPGGAVDTEFVERVAVQKGTEELSLGLGLLERFFHYNNYNRMIADVMQFIESVKDNKIAMDEIMNQTKSLSFSMGSGRTTIRSRNANASWGG